MDLKPIRSKLFTDYVKNVYGNSVYRIQFDKKIIFINDDDWASDTDVDKWLFYIDLEKEGIFLINEEKFYPIDAFMKKIDNLKAFF